MRRLIDRLERDHKLTKEEWIAVITERADRDYLFERARTLAKQYYGNAVSS